MVKRGDKIKVLPSAFDVFVATEMIGETFLVGGVYPQPYDYAIFVTDKKGFVWGLRDIDFEPVVKVGDQLLFNFMTEEL